MKILKYILYAVVVLAVLFFAMGLIKPTVSYGHEISVAKSLKESWAVTKDASKYHLWLEGFQSIELLEGEQDQPGSKYKVIVNPGDGQEEFEMTQTLISVNEFEEVVLHYDSEFMNFEHKIIHAGNESKSTVKSESKVIPKGWMMRSMFAAMETFGGSFTSQEIKNMEALKKVIEENTTDYYPVAVQQSPEATSAENE